MKQKFVLALTAIGLFGLGGCAVSQHNVHNQVNATGINLMTARQGTDCSYAIFGFIPVNRTHIDQAARKGNVSSLGYVEYDYTNYVLFTKDCVTVYDDKH